MTTPPGPPPTSLDELEAQIRSVGARFDALIEPHRPDLWRYCLRLAARAARPPHALVARYLDAFNRRDPDALAALFDPDATNDIVGDWEEHGVEAIRRPSLTYWAADPGPQSGELGQFEGRDAVFVFAPDASGHEALHSNTSFEIESDRIVRHRWYYFCPELLQHVSAALGVPAVTHGYRAPGAWS